MRSRAGPRVLERILAALSLLAAAATAAPPAERIRVCAENPFYWTYKGRPVLLLGGSDEDNLFNRPALLDRNLADLARCGGNYIRSTLSCRDEGNVWPFQRRDGLYDLDRFHPPFWERLARSLREAEERGIIVQIEIWATFDYYRDNWKKNPFNPARNRNYTTRDTRLVEVWDHHPARKPQPFFFSPPELNDDRVLRRYQEAFARKVLDVSLPFGNVLYCLDNETKTPPQWAWYWAAFLREEARKRGARIEVTEMWDDWDITSPRHHHTFDRPDLFSFADISQNNWQEGATHYERLLAVRRLLARREAGPCPMNNVKIYGRRRVRYAAPEALSLERFWQAIFAGCASARFHRPPTGIGLNPTARRAIRAARTFTSSFDIFACAPRDDLLGDRAEEAHALAKPGEVYAVYLPAGGNVTLRVPERRGFTVRWFDPRKARFADPIPGGGTRPIRLTSPDRGRTWLALVR